MPLTSVTIARQIVIDFNSTASQPNLAEAEKGAPATVDLASLGAFRGASLRSVEIIYDDDTKAIRGTPTELPPQMIASTAAVTALLGKQSAKIKPAAAARKAPKSKPKPKPKAKPKRRRR